MGGLVLLELPFVTITTTAYSTDKGFFPSMNTDMSYVPFTAQESFSAGRTPLREKKILYSLVKKKRT